MIGFGPNIAVATFVAASSVIRGVLGLASSRISNVSSSACGEIALRAISDACVDAWDDDAGGATCDCEVIDALPQPVVARARGQATVARIQACIEGLDDRIGQVVPDLLFAFRNRPD